MNRDQVWHVIREPTAIRSCGEAVRKNHIKAEIKSTTRNLVSREKKIDTENIEIKDHLAPEKIDRERCSL